MKLHCWLIGAISFMAGGYGLLCLAREFGPEWTAIKAPNTDRVIEFRKEIKVPVVNYNLGGGSNYAVQLESDRLQIVEQNDNRGFYIEIPKYGRFEVSKNSDETPAWQLIRLSDVQYWDLNGDGILDLMSDMRGTERINSILLDSCFVRIWGGQAGHAMMEAYSPDRKIRYLFKNGEWRITE